MSDTEHDRVGPAAPEGQGAPVGYGVRLAWADLPASVHVWVEESLGSPVVGSASQAGGFSPGSADRVVTADGACGFVKAVSPEQNPDTPDVHRREIAVLREMPPGLGVPRLIASLDDGHWVALIVEDVEGRHPRIPWVDEEVRATLQALADLQRHSAPDRWPRLEEELVGEFGAWARIAQARPSDLDPWLAARLGELDTLGRVTLPRVAGDGVCHTDTRADNLLLTPEGTVRVVDWPWASRGRAVVRRDDPTDQPGAVRRGRRHGIPAAGAGSRRERHRRPRHDHGPQRLLHRGRHPAPGAGAAHAAGFPAGPGGGRDPAAACSGGRPRRRTSLSRWPSSTGS